MKYGPGELRRVIREREHPVLTGLNSPPDPPPQDWAGGSRELAKSRRRQACQREMESFTELVQAGVLRIQ